MCFLFSFLFSVYSNQTSHHIWLMDLSNEIQISEPNAPWVGTICIHPQPLSLKQGVTNCKCTCKCAIYNIDQ